MAELRQEGGDLPGAIDVVEQLEPSAYTAVSLAELYLLADRPDEVIELTDGLSNELRFHDLRHSFGSIAVNAALSGRELQAWMGHADFRTTERYMHYRERGDEAARLASAFAPLETKLQAEVQANDLHEASTAFRTAEVAAA